jgi:hypothetical protein
MEPAAVPYISCSFSIFQVSEDPYDKTFYENVKKWNRKTAEILSNYLQNTDLRCVVYMILFPCPMDAHTHVGRQLISVSIRTYWELRLKGDKI